MFQFCFFISIAYSYCITTADPPPPPPKPKPPVIEVLKNCSLDAVSYAVARQETSGCTTGVGKSQNNCHGFRKKGVYLTFANPAESHAYFKRLWSNSYGGGCPNLAKAQRYVSET